MFVKKPCEVGQARVGTISMMEPFEVGACVCDHAKAGPCVAEFGRTVVAAAVAAAEEGHH